MTTLEITLIIIGVVFPYRKLYGKMTSFPIRDLDKISRYEC